MLKNSCRNILLILSLALIGCGDPPTKQFAYNAPQENPPKKEYDPDCVPTIDCISENARCGILIDDCGNELECGTCIQPYVCGGLGTPNRCENPCEDASICTEAHKTFCKSTAEGPVCTCEPGYHDDGDGNCQKNKNAIIRLMSANLTSGNGQTYKGPGIRIFKGLKPDIVFIQEFNYSKELDSEFSYNGIPDFVAKTFGSEFYYFRGNGSTIPNGIISRYPIIDSGNWEQSQTKTRAFTWARIDIPGDIDLYAISVHLLTDTVKRSDDAEELVDYINKNIPKGVYLAIGGDFNTDSRNEYVYRVLQEVVTVRGEYPDDQNGNEHTNAKRNSTYDGVYVDAKLHALETMAIVGSTKHESGLVFDSRKFNPLSDVSPVQKNDSGADQMQHMAVVRDFKIW